MTERLDCSDLIAALTDSAAHWDTVEQYLEFFLPVEFTKVEDVKGLRFIYGKQSVKRITEKGVVVDKVPFAIDVEQLLGMKYKGEMVWMNEEHQAQAMQELTAALPTYKFTNNAEKREEQEQERAFAIAIQLEKASYWCKYALKVVFLRQLGARISDMQAAFNKAHFDYRVLHPQPKAEKKVVQKAQQLGLHGL